MIHKIKCSIINFWSKFGRLLTYLFGDSIVTSNDVIVEIVNERNEKKNL